MALCICRHNLNKELCQHGISYIRSRSYCDIVVCQHRPCAQIIQLRLTHTCQENFTVIKALFLTQLAVSKWGHRMQEVRYKVTPKSFHKTAVVYVRHHHAQFLSKGHDATSCLCTLNQHRTVMHLACFSSFPDWLIATQWPFSYLSFWWSLVYSALLSLNQNFMYIKG